MRLMAIPIGRICPKCSKPLKIDTMTHKVSCSRCGYVEPCHLRHLIPNKKNCCKCPYSPYFEKKKIKSLKKILLAKEKTKASEEGHRPKNLKLIDILALLKWFERGKQITLSNPELEKKCFQAWNPERTKQTRKWNDLEL